MRIVWSILLVLLLVPGYSTEPLRPMIGHLQAIRTTPVPLFADKPAKRRLGELTYLGGVVLKADDRAFGGFSAIDVAGDRFTLLSDLGYFVRFRLSPDWRVSDIMSASLPDGPGAGWLKLDRDSESLVRDPVDGSFLIGFENANAIWRYNADLSAAIGHVAPPLMASWPDNVGPESITRMPGGGFAVISEGGYWPGKQTRAALRFAANPVDNPQRLFRFGYRKPRRHTPADATLLPDGRIAILDRGFSPMRGFTVKLAVIDPAAIRPGATVPSRVIASFAAPAIHDNFEGIAATREGDDTILWIVSDDNLSWFQRTLLLKFRLDPRRGTAGPTGD